MIVATTLAACLLTALAAQVPAQRSKPTSRPTLDRHGVKMDPLSRATLDRWETMEYHPGRSGLKTVSFTVLVESKGPLGEAKATGKYNFTGKKSTLTWDNPGLGNMLADRGWSKQTFNRLFIGDSHRRSLEKTELTAKKNADGTTTLHVKGETPGGYKSFTYGKDGVQRGFTVGVSDPMAGGVDATIRVEHEKIGKKYVRKGWSYDLSLPTGAVHGEVSVTNLRFGKHRVYGKVVEKLRMAGAEFGTNVLTFSDYKINGVGGSTTSKPKAAPTSRPAPKAGLRAIKQVKKS